jgi:EAL domain-containing protein (putative c-di-GMP-specific phosphodiesterase class I)
MSSVVNTAASFDVYEHIRRYNRLVGTDITFAFQTIMDASEFEVVGFEALVRGIRNEPAAQVMSRVSHDQRFDFDQACRIRAIEAASEFEIDVDLHLNATDIKAANVETVVAVTRHLAKRHKIEPQRIVLELNNLGSLGGEQPLTIIRTALADAGFRTLADNFGQRDADLRPLAVFRPELVKIDHRLVEGINDNPVAQALVRGLIEFCRALDIEPVASGVETAEEFRWLQQAGLRLFQGYFFAQPQMNNSAD